MLSEQARTILRLWSRGTIQSNTEKYGEADYSRDAKDWDKMIPYLLFAYREVPQSSTGFSPFELLYGREVRGPLDVLRDQWEANEKSEESVISYVIDWKK